MKSTRPTITEPTEFPTTGIFTVAHKDKVISRGVRVLRKLYKGYEIEALASMVINSKGKILMPGQKAIVNDFMVKFGNQNSEQAEKILADAHIHTEPRKAQRKK